MRTLFRFVYIPQVKEELCYGSARCPKALSRLCRAAENTSGTSPIAYGLAFLFSSVRRVSVSRLLCGIYKNAPRLWEQSYSKRLFCFTRRLRSQFRASAHLICFLTRRAEYTSPGRIAP